MTLNGDKKIVKYGILLISEGMMSGQMLAHFQLFIFRMTTKNSKTNNRSKKIFCMYLCM